MEGHDRGAGIDDALLAKGFLLGLTVAVVFAALGVVDVPGRDDRAADHSPG